MSLDTQPPPPNGGQIPDPFDPANLRLSQDFLKTGGVIKQHTIIPNKKPGSGEWFRLHSSEDYRFDTLVLEIKGSTGGGSGDTYLIDPSLHAELATLSLVSARTIYFGVTRSGNPFIWPVRLPAADGRANSWSDSAREAVAEALEGWIRIEANMGVGGYDIFKPRVPLPDPQWPAMPMSDILRIAFRNRLINDMDHIVLRSLRGEI